MQVCLYGVPCCRISQRSCCRILDVLHSSAAPYVQLCTGGTYWDLLQEGKLSSPMLSVQGEQTSGEADQEPPSKLPLTLRERCIILKESALGMIYLHSRKPPVIHRDLKAINILIDSIGTAKVTLHTLVTAHSHSPQCYPRCLLMLSYCLFALTTSFR
jgi:serine/threonine protein kinase